MPNAAGPLNPSSDRSRPSRVAGGSCAAGCGPIGPSGSCSAALTTCSSSGAAPDLSTDQEQADQRQHDAPLPRTRRCSQPRIITRPTGEQPLCNSWDALTVTKWDSRWPQPGAGVDQSGAEHQPTDLPVG